MSNFRRSLPVAFVAILITALGAIGGSAPASAKEPAPLAGVSIVNRASGMCLDVPGGSTENKLQVQQYNCNGAVNQQWEYLPGAYAGFGQLRNVASQKCLDVRATSTSIGAVVQQYICMDVPNQQWSYSSGTGYLMALHSGMCAGVYSLVYKEKVYQAVCGGGSQLVFTTWNASI
ncbi:RICIN domain-containing protein [Micromonospora sp. RTGN7]|uniref:RICIN domain-containing protein n=1 Tax=Micromonospora sp. RTGN7 TaxID=3016526 RepID=UPI0029FF201D|nr:RICIN domain-containing protein [Micromonospora sp. RTGN7]